MEPWEYNIRPTLWVTSSMDLIIFFFLLLLISLNLHSFITYISIPILFYLDIPLFIYYLSLNS